MDLLLKAYLSPSGDDDGHGKGEEPQPEVEPTPPPSKRFNPQYPPVVPKPCPLIPSKYISKRERSLSTPAIPPPLQNPDTAASPDADLPCGILTSFGHQAKCCSKLGQMSERLYIDLKSHKRFVNTIQWSPTHVHHLASAGLDHTIRIWNIWSRDQKKACEFRYHNAAVKGVKWLQRSLSILSCGYYCSSRLIDAEKGLQTQIFPEDQEVGVIKLMPGGSKGYLKLWDIRTGKVVHEYIGLGLIFDIEFTVYAKTIYLFQ